MRIKQVLLSGFKSYRSQETFDDFHPRTNVLVGRNGSGKSNLIFAIRFVLSSDLLNLRAEERKQLIHHGKENIVAGYVEIVFDNSDKRFPVDSTEVKLRRNIGLAKADFLLNGKHIVADDVMNLLESAGLSRSNPYYIVQQGKVRALSQMKPDERLEVLREVAGTRVYDDRRAESVKLMEETKGRKEKINELLGILDQRMTELEEEKGELAQFQELDRTRKALEFTIYSKELSDLSAQLQAVDDARAQEVNEASGLYEQTAKIREEIKEMEKRSKEIAIDVEKMTKERDLLLGERDSDLQTKARRELEVQTLTTSHNDELVRYEKLDKEIKQLEKEISKAQKSLSALTAKLQQALNEEADLNEKALDHQRRIRELHGRQGRSAQFKTVKERDDWLDKELSTVASTLKNKRDQQKKMETELNSMQAQRQGEEEKLSARHEAARDYRETMDKLSADSVTATEKRDKAANKRKELWRNEAEVTAELQSLRENIGKLERQLNATLPKEQAQGLEAVKRLKAEHPRELQGVFAPLIELFTCTEEESLAIEATAKNQLFNVVVDTDETAATLLQMLNREKAGRVTFMPLNKLNVKDSKFPRTDSAVPLIERLKFKPSYRKAFLHVFGRTLLCPTIEEAAAISRQHDVDCVTIDADQVSRKGALTGGFTDKKRSRLAVMSSLRESRDKHENLTRQLDEIHKDLSHTDSLITKYLGELEQIEQKRAQRRHAYESSTSESSAAQKHALSLQNQEQRLESALVAVAQEVKQLEETDRSYKAERGTKLVSKLTREEENLLHSLTSDLVDIEKKLADQSSTRAHTQALKNVDEMRLSQNLLAQLRELEREKAAINLGEEERRSVQMQTELSALEENLARIDERLQELDESLSKQNKAAEDLRNQLEASREKESEQARQLQDESGAIDKSLTNRSVLLQKRDECQRKLREVGNIPPAAQKQYEKKNVQQLVKSLHETRKELKEYGNVNKKALDQYSYFKEQREDLQARKAELDESEKAIDKLVQTLDEKKEAAIDRTFKMVAKNFSDVFSELTVHGEASLKLLTKDGAEGEPAGEGEAARQYTGVDIEVSFTKRGKPQKMHQLSGGQQSIVALALIFAIQKCDPAPFYVFDEIDAALDDQHRHTVAEMIEKLSASGTQFIVTSHRPEMIQHAHKHYLIKFMNKVSSIGVASQEEALEVIQHDEGEDINVSAHKQAAQDEGEGGNGDDPMDVAFDQ